MDSMAYINSPHKGANITGHMPHANVELAHSKFEDQSAFCDNAKS